MLTGADIRREPAFGVRYGMMTTPPPPPGPIFTFWYFLPFGNLKLKGYINIIWQELVNEEITPEADLAA